MQLKFLRCKLHLAKVTNASINYHGSLTIDPLLMDAIGLYPYESILVSNTATGARAETYALPGIPGAGQIELNGAMARIGSPGDRIIVMAYVWLDPSEIASHQPRVVVLDERNHIIEEIEYSALVAPEVDE